MTVMDRPRTALQYRAWWMQTRPDVPFGTCWCGCGRRTMTSPKTNANRLLFRGQPLRYLHRHVHPGATGRERLRKRAKPRPVSGVCVFPGCVTRINREHLKRGWTTCMRHDGEQREAS